MMITPSLASWTLSRVFAPAEVFAEVPVGSVATMRELTAGGGEWCQFIGVFIHMARLNRLVSREGGRGGRIYKCARRPHEPVLRLN